MRAVKDGLPAPYGEGEEAESPRWARAMEGSQVICLGGKEEKKVLGECPTVRVNPCSHPAVSIDSSGMCSLLDSGDDVLICVSQDVTF